MGWCDNNFAFILRRIDFWWGFRLRSAKRSNWRPQATWSLKVEVFNVCSRAKLYTSYQQSTSEQHFWKYIANTLEWASKIHSRNRHLQTHQSFHSYTNNKQTNQQKVQAWSINPSRRPSSSRSIHNQERVCQDWSWKANPLQSSRNVRVLVSPKDSRHAPCHQLCWSNPRIKTKHTNL